LDRKDIELRPAQTRPDAFFAVAMAEKMTTKPVVEDALRGLIGARKLTPNEGSTIEPKSL